MHCGSEMVGELGALARIGVLSQARAEATCPEAGAQLWCPSRLSASLLYASEAAHSRKITFCLVYSGGQSKGQTLASISSCVTMEKTILAKQENPSDSMPVN